MHAIKSKPAKKRPIKLFQPGLFDGQEAEKPADESTAKVTKPMKAKISPRSKTSKRKTQRQGKNEQETLEIPTLQEAIDQSGDVTGVAPECHIMPMNSEATTRRLCESIRAAGQANPIHLDTEGKLLNGRHRLIACCALGIEPEFKIVDPANRLLHVLADTTQREYKVATLASIALKVEAFLKQCCKELKEQTGRDILAGRRVQRDHSIDTGGKEPTLMYAGETLRDVAIRIAGSRLSAVRRLTTVMNKDPDLAEQAITGKITLKDAENELAQKCEKPDSEQPAGKLEAAHCDTSNEPDPTGRAETSITSAGALDTSVIKVTNATPKKRDSTPPAAKPLKVTAVGGSELRNGKMEFWKGSRSAILIPDRQIASKSGVRIILDSGDELKIQRVKTLSLGRLLIDRFLNHGELST